MQRKKKDPFAKLSSKSIIAAVNKVTIKWAKQRKAEERHERRKQDRDFVFQDRTPFTGVAPEILPDGYAHASGNGKYTVDRRQLYYAVREKFREATGQEIGFDYFSQTLLVRFMNENPETESWKITSQPRGTLRIPNAGYEVVIPCGTIAIDRLLQAISTQGSLFGSLEGLSVRAQWPSLAEGQRFRGVIYIEKEGFEPQIREAGIAETFGLAILSCKGQSVVAARKFIDHVCRLDGGVPLFVVHDLDKAGFEIAQRLTTVSEHAVKNNLVKYRFKNKLIPPIDLGLRLEDARRYGLQSEMFEFRGHFPNDTITTGEERQFLKSGRRIELNAFTAPDFIRWLTESLRRYLPDPFIPPDALIEDAYRLALAKAELNRRILTAKQEAIKNALSAKVAPDIRDQLASRLATSDLQWDQGLYQMAEADLNKVEK